MSSPSVQTAPKLSVTAHTPEPHGVGGLKAGWHFIQERWPAILLLSIIVLIPCFWHAHIQATDLGSHVYNTWLAQLIRSGEAPGLQFVPRTSNILFDLMLDSLFQSLGPSGAERVSVSLCVLVFFWGCFSLSAAASETPPWRVVPLIAMFSYGWVFNMGFFNLYLSVGLSFFALAILWRGKRWDMLALAPLAGLIWMAHLTGMAGLVCFGTFLVLARKLPGKLHLYLVSVAALSYLAVRWWATARRFVAYRGPEHEWISGADQLVLYGNSYQWIAWSVLLLAALAIVQSLIRKDERLSFRSTWVQLYLLMTLVLLTVPAAFLDPVVQVVGFVPYRLSIYAAALLCCLVALSRPNRWLVLCFAAAAILFFSFLYYHTLQLEKLEKKVEVAVAHLRPGDRVVATVLPLPGRIHEQHIVDRACIGHCFYLGNYEPTSFQFRTWAAPHNKVAAASGLLSFQMQRGIYRVKAEDLPLKEIERCGPEQMDICIYDLKAGELNGQRVLDELGLPPKTPAY